MKIRGCVLALTTLFPSAFAVAPAGKQDEEIGRLIEQLDQDDIVARERAGERLVEIGPPARAALKKIAEGKGEVSARARSILGEIELAENRKKAFGSTYRVTIPGGEYALSRIAGLVKEQIGVPLQIPQELADTRLKIEVRDMLLWEFLDRLCKVHGGMCVPSNQPQDSIALKTGKPAGSPVFYSGPFRVWIDRLRLERRDPYDKKYDRGSMVLGIAWQPNLRPINTFHVKPEFVVREIKADDGKVLGAEPKKNSPYSGMLLGPIHPRAALEFVPFEHPQKGVRRLARVGGFAVVRLPVKWETVTFEKPLESVGKTRQVGNYSITLKECKAGNEGIAATLFVAVPESSSDQSERERSVSLMVRCEKAWLVDDTGKEHDGRQASGGNHSTGGGQEELEYPVTFPAVARPSELRIRFMADFLEKRVEFEFKDVDLP